MTTGERMHVKKKIESFPGCIPPMGRHWNIKKVLQNKQKNEINTMTYIIIKAAEWQGKRCFVVSMATAPPRVAMETTMVEMSSETVHAVNNGMAEELHK